MDATTTKAVTIGIALSGGGSRAMAFHLGCLGTLHRPASCRRRRVLSTVSGGSVIGAMYAVHDGDFAELRGRGAIGPGGRLRPPGPADRAHDDGRVQARCSCLGVQGLAWIFGLPARAVGRLVGSKARAVRTAASVRQPDDDPAQDDGRPPVRRPQAVRPRPRGAPPRHGRLRAAHGVGLLLRAHAPPGSWRFGTIDPADGHRGPGGRRRRRPIRWRSRPSTRT